MSPTRTVFVALCFCACAMAAPCRAQDAEVHNPAAPPKLSTVTGPLRIAVIGLVHGHVEGLLGRAKDSRDITVVVLTYPSATAVIQASWAWTHDNKEVDVFTEKGSLHAAKWDALESRLPDKPPQKLAPAQGTSEIENEWVYLTSVVRGTSPVDPLSSVELNLICVEILDAARRVPIRSGPPAGDAAR